MNARRPLISAVLALVVVVGVAVVAAAGSAEPPTAVASVDPTEQVAKISISGVGNPGTFLSVLAYEWSGEAPSGGAGSPDVGDLAITRRLDNMSPSLFKTFATQRHIDTVVFDVLVPGGTALATEYKLSQAVISSFHHSATGTPDYEFPFDRITINFGRVCISTFNHAGGQSTPVCVNTT